MVKVTVMIGNGVTLVVPDDGGGNVRFVSTSDGRRLMVNSDNMWWWLKIGSGDVGGQRLLAVIGGQ